MSEENALEDINIPDKTPEYTEVEAEQMKEGWIPPEREDQLDGKPFLTAEQYRDRGNFFKKINAQQKVIDRLETSIGHINEHNQRISDRDLQTQKAEYERTIEKFKQEKVAALDEGDSRRVVEIDEAIRKTTQPAAQPSGPPPEFAVWKEKNEWYNRDSELKSFADMIGDGYAARHPRASPSELFAFAEKETKARFPDKFENEQRRAAPSVEGGGSPAPKKTSSKLTAEEQSIFDDLNVSKYFKTDADKQKYIKDVISVRD